MNTIVEHINSVGHTFVEFALPMLIQSSVLIAILLLVDLLLRKKVKAVFRYWIWMLVLVKLVLPTSLSSPLSLGYFFGDKLTYQDLAQSSPTLEPTVPAQADISPGIDPLFIQPNPYIPPTEPVTSVFEPAIAEPVSPPQVPVTPLSWHGVVFLVWLVVVIAMGLLLLQRALFVRGLVAQAKKAGHLMNDALAYCSASMGIKSKVGLKVSVNATTPSVCGLIRPVILVPWNLTSTLGASRLRTILMHELAHIRRGDLWVNLAQTALQIIYFYNPLLWLANCLIRRIREQSVDEAVLVAMGTKARQYPQMLVDVAKMAFKRPALSLRLIGVVESKSALAGRIKHILGRPLPKTARLGIVGVLVVIIAGAILLPMARARNEDKFFDKDLLIKFTELPEGAAKKVSVDDTTIWSKSYEVEFAPGQDLLVAVEMYQAGKPMWIPGQCIFKGSQKPGKFTVTFVRTYQDIAKKYVTHNIKFQLGNQVFKIPELPMHTPLYFSTEAWDWYRGEGLQRPETRHTKTKYAGIETLFYYGAADSPEESEDDESRFWIPGRDVTPIMSNHCIALKMMPLSSLKYLSVEPIGGYQGLDGKIMSRSLTLEKADRIAGEYKQMVIDSVEKQSTAEKQADMETDVQVEVEKTPQTVFTATLSNGVTVELVGLCEEPVGGAKWWKPDGRYMPEPFFKANKRTPPSKGMTTQYAFLAKAEGSEDISIKMKIYEGFGWSTQVAEDGTALCYIKHPNDAKPYHEDAFSQGPIEVGVAQGQWIKGRGVSSPNIQIPRSYSIGNHDEIVIQPPRPEKNSPEMATIFWFTSSSHDYEYRLICTLKDGSVEECMKPFFQSANIIETGNLKNSTLNTKSFNIDRPLEQIVNYELLYRKFD
ncbi:MAG: M56 family metallopeptidase, partial [Sedimentisphaerales bacterium]